MQAHSQLRSPQLLLGLPQEVLASRIAALLPPDDRHDDSGRNSASRPPACLAPEPEAATHPPAGSA